MNRRGFSLVEVLVAGAIFLACSLMMAQLLKAGLAFTGRAARLQHDTMKLQSEMEELRAMPASELLVYNGQTFASGEGEIVISAVSADLLSVALRLRGLGLTTLRSNL